MMVSKVNELSKCRKLTAGRASLMLWRGCGCRETSRELWGRERSRPERMERMPKVKRWGGKDKQGEKRDTERDGLKMATKSAAIWLCRQHLLLSSHTVFFFWICVWIVFLDELQTDKESLEGKSEKVLGCHFLHPNTLAWITVHSCLT